MPKPTKSNRIRQKRKDTLSSDDNNFIDKVVEYSRKRPKLAKAILERVLYNINTDNLTGILSKKGLEGLLDEVKLSEMPSGILYFDMMGLKEINDKYGHNAGDRAIKKVANTLNSLIRSKKTEDYESERRRSELEDFWNKDSLYSKIGSNVGRIYEGGDEFVGVLRDIQGFIGLKAATKRISDYFNKNNYPPVAIGAALHLQYQDIKKTIADAEESMYAAKESLHKRRNIFNMEEYNTGYGINYPGIGINVILPKTELNIEIGLQQKVSMKLLKEKNKTK